jgi:hypothetical protein
MTPEKDAAPATAGTVGEGRKVSNSGESLKTSKPESTKAQSDLLPKIQAAVTAVNEAEGNVTTAQGDLVARSKVLGTLLLEAKKLHPKVKDFEAYLKQVDGLKLSRAYDYLRIAGGRATDEELRKEARERKQNPAQSGSPYRNRNQSSRNRSLRIP